MAKNASHPSITQDFPADRIKDAVRIGVEIRQLRQAKRMTLQNLADAAGLSIGFLNRFHTMPREAPLDLVEEWVAACADAAARFAEAGLDGVELVASQGLRHRKL